jgi:hypothetical protein
MQGKSILRNAVQTPLFGKSPDDKSEKKHQGDFKNEQQRRAEMIEQYGNSDKKNIDYQQDSGRLYVAVAQLEHQVMYVRLVGRKRRAPM